jgi:hypothetical protein
VAKQVFQMCPDNRCSLVCNGCHHRLFVIGNCLSFNHADGAFGTGSDAGTQTVAEEIGYKPGFPVNDLERSLRAVGDALAAPRAFLLIDADDLPFHIVLSLPDPPGSWYHRSIVMDYALCS